MSAIISECGLYRFRLEREVQPEGKVFAFFGINPSTADADLDDATVRKWRGFTLRNDGRKFIVGNVFAFRATDVSEVRKHYIAGAPGRGSVLLEAQLSTECGYWQDIIGQADVLVPCWGNSSKVPAAIRGRLGVLLSALIESRKPVLHFGLTASGDPKHPLMLGYDTPLIPWVKP